MTKRSQLPDSILEFAVFGCLMLLALSATAAPPSEPPVNVLDRIAEGTVTLGLQLQVFDPNQYIYLGPEEREAEARSAGVPLPKIESALRGLRKQLAETVPAREPERAHRRALLGDRLGAMITRAKILQGEPPERFDDEVARLFSVRVPRHDEAHFRALAAPLETLLPGDEPLAERVAKYRERFVVPPDRLRKVMLASLAECRRRTKAHLALPASEAVELNIVNDAYFVGFTEYLGRGRSVIHINASVPIHLERVVELGCHEGYPGHHVQATLMEAELVDRRGWVEFTFLPLYGAQAVMAEGAANYGVDLAFTPAERIAFERDVILPLAGMEAVADELETYQRYVSLLDELNYARNETARRYLFGGETREQATEWLMRFGLETRGTATQRLAFIDALRTYVINYNYGKDWVKRMVERRAPATETERWDLLRQLIEKPLYPLSSDL